MVIFYLILFLAACTDLKSFRISNRLMIAGYLLGLVHHLTGTCPASVFLFSLYAFFIWLITIPLFCTRVIGGGDCKLFALCGLYTGFARTIFIGIYAFFSAGIVCVILLACRRLLPKRKEIHTLHFSIFILLGVILESRMGGLL